MTEPLPDGARDALRLGGERLISQLGQLREAGSETADVDPLDPAATLALRRHGDGLLADLERQRAVLAGRPTFWQRFRWLGVTAAAVGFLTAGGLIGELLFPGKEPAPLKLVSTESLQPPDVPDPLGHAASVPEPSSGLLLVLAGAILAGRRRRPAGSRVGNQ